MFSTLELKAQSVGGNSKMLKRRLNDARSVLTEYFLLRFKPGRYEYDQKRLVSDCGHFALVWSVRPRPKSPISYENQQTSVGSVKLVRL